MDIRLIPVVHWIAKCRIRPLLVAGSPVMYVAPPPSSVANLRSCRSSSACFKKDPLLNRNLTVAFQPAEAGSRGCRRTRRVPSDRMPSRIQPTVDQPRHFTAQHIVHGQAGMPGSRQRKRQLCGRVKRIRPGGGKRELVRQRSGVADGVLLPVIHESLPEQAGIDHLEGGFPAFQPHGEETSFLVRYRREDTMIAILHTIVVPDPSKLFFKLVGFCGVFGMEPNFNL